jgi:hypothetical protein
MDHHLLEDDYLSQAEEIALAEVELLILLLAYFAFHDRQRYPLYTA